MKGDTAEVSASSMLLITMTPPPPSRAVSSEPHAPPLFELSSFMSGPSCTALTSNLGKLRLPLLGGEATDEACESVRA